MILLSQSEFTRFQLTIIGLVDGSERVTLLETLKNSETIGVSLFLTVQRAADLRTLGWSHNAPTMQLPLVDWASHGSHYI